MKRPPKEWPPDDPRLTPVTLRQAYVASGYTDRALMRMVRDGTLARARRGAYVAGPVWRDLDEVGRHSVRARAALAQAKAPGALSHVSGALEFDVPIWDLDLSDVHVTRFDGRIGRHEAGIRQHAGVVRPGDVVKRNGVAVTCPARLALEVTTMTDSERALVVVCDLLHRRLTTLQDLSARYARMEQWPNSLATQVVLRLADPRIETVGEARTLHLCFSQSLPMPTPQVEIRDPNGVVVARVDFAWPELGVFLEFDGKIKYEKLLKEGERASDVVVREKAREELICRLTGWRCIRITWADLADPLRTAALIRRALYPSSTAA
ncbi:type IV toxin-antitoxin system AbiEi family antitoxin domain-containing protein [Nocardioides sp. T2.26MG-1]|uniref:type IV toxin-antitoxin system AbiEi family antitoxin domain-containing protein n=1 Tax=Nocardioides sp. T2.26MG-1 TaxID=3041166 RepID=UPI00247752AA|nr:type IV toxin-antitoxin system AbiEi family antitoxin domain-containing protein [Nocardioides sp. T2.26MG-1]CAI9405301.1 hypothetical protein HIDPHFAB_04353 [Nocardioides sp. T2.26MG-1]